MRNHSFRSLNIIRFFLYFFRNRKWIWYDVTRNLSGVKKFVWRLFKKQTKLRKEIESWKEIFSFFQEFFKKFLIIFFWNQFLRKNSLSKTNQIFFFFSSLSEQKNCPSRKMNPEWKLWGQFCWEVQRTECRKAECLWKGWKVSDWD